MTTGGGKKGKGDITPTKRAEVNHRLVEKLKELVKDLPVEVIGHIDSPAICCRNGTVAIVEIDGDRVE
jgi:hypothetical protein